MADWQTNQEGGLKITNSIQLLDFADDAAGGCIHHVGHLCHKEIFKYMERSSRRDHSRDPEDDASSDAGTSTRLRRRMRSMVAESDGADTDASSTGHPTEESQRRPGRRRRARKALEDMRNFTRIKRQRSMSNGSNTSSTSGSSMASEPLTESQRRARSDQKMAELEQKKKMVEDGTLAEFCRRVAAFKEERNRLLQTAELHKNLQLKNGQDLYNFEVQRANNFCKNDQIELKNKMLSKVDAVMAKLQAEMKVLSKPGAKIEDIKKELQQKCTPDTMMHIAASLEKQTELEMEKGKLPVTPPKAPLCKRRKADSPKKATLDEMLKLLPDETIRLPFDALSTDIATIVSTCKQIAKATVEHISNSIHVPYKLERRRLICGKNLFVDGDEVQISLPLMHEDYRGTISSITDEAVYVKLASGHKVRILLPHIEFRRCELKPALRSSLSTGNLHSLRWSETLSKQEAEAPT
ncbi:Sds3-like [Plasmopara halstedii]|uniref:Sds3-like n=1 Tax=Plasmopara halstedii TaxID=4781 RepID=A0A0P1AGK4_PLAHL|nr:Sds3-like [Plasmopara halstedii]CEG39810.1 Sds3-like [Plasmopara halstedii]|eukprot:XP_024576179.1 Sds3-like [Plasmopara halstedii]